MAQYINKASLVAEIEKLDNFWHLSKSSGGQAFVESLFSFIDTLEVKEVELTVDDIKNIDKLLNQCVDYSNPYQEVLKRFKAQEGE